MAGFIDNGGKILTRSELNEWVTDIQKELKDTIEERENTIKSRNIWIKENQELQTKLDGTIEKFSYKRNKNSELRKKLEAVTAERDELVLLLGQANVICEQYQKDIIATQDLRDKLEETITEKAEDYSLSQEEICNLKGDVRCLHKIADDKDDVIKIGQLAINASQLVIKNLENELHKSESNFKDCQKTMQAGFDQAHKLNHKLKLALETLKKDREEFSKLQILKDQGIDLRQYLQLQESRVREVLKTLEDKI